MRRSPRQGNGEGKNQDVKTKGEASVQGQVESEAEYMRIYNTRK